MGVRRTLSGSPPCPIKPAGSPGPTIPWRPAPVQAEFLSGHHHRPSRRPMTEIVTRFAPSPTGSLHIGGARTALFNWLFARHHGGRFLLRIEDTDRARSTEEATRAIFDGLEWLELDWDGEPVSQASRAERHRAAATQMLEAGSAYRCYARAEENAEFRENARAEGRPPTFRRPCRARAPSEAPAGPFTVRLRATRVG